MARNFPVRVMQKKSTVKIIYWCHIDLCWEFLLDQSYSQINFLFTSSHSKQLLIFGVTSNKFYWLGVCVTIRAKIAQRCLRLVNTYQSSAFIKLQTSRHKIIRPKENSSTDGNPQYSGYESGKKSKKNYKMF